MYMLIFLFVCLNLFGQHDSPEVLELIKYEYRELNLTDIQARQMFEFKYEGGCGFFHNFVQKQQYDSIFVSQILDSVQLRKFVAIQLGERKEYESHLMESLAVYEKNIKLISILIEDYRNNTYPKIKSIKNIFEETLNAKEVENLKIARKKYVKYVSNLYLEKREIEEIQDYFNIIIPYREKMMNLMECYPFFQHNYGRTILCEEILGELRTFDSKIEPYKTEVEQILSDFYDRNKNIIAKIPKTQGIATVLPDQFLDIDEIDKAFLLTE